MCVAGQPPGGFAGTAEALAAAKASLGYLARAGAASLPAGELAGCLRDLEAVESVHTAARANILTAFTGQAAYTDDGHGAARTWLRWQTRITGGAAAGAVGWMKRLDAHPGVFAALADTGISASVALELCKLTDRLPEDDRPGADQILLTAHQGGSTLADLAGLVEEMLRRSAPPDTDGDDPGFGSRGVQLDVHFRGAGKLAGDLTPECTAALAAVLESLGKKAGPEDDRTQAQRRHDALEELCRRQIGGGGLPDVAGQPAQVQLTMTLDQLRALDGAPETEAAWAARAAAAWAAGRAAGGGQPGWSASRAAAEAYACDAVISPVVVGHIDPAALAAMIRAFLACSGLADCPVDGCLCPAAGIERLGSGSTLPGNAVLGGPQFGPGWELRGPSPRPGTCPHGTRPAGARAAGVHSAGVHSAGARPAGVASPYGLPAPLLARLQDAMLRCAADVLSGPAGLAAALRTGLSGPQAAGVSLPLDTGAPTKTVPAHLRRAVTIRDRHCTFPGCRQPPVACQVHHLVPRSRGGPTALHNLALVCAFHHLIAIHRWGWTLSLNGDGTTTAISPDRTRTLHSHGPPVATG